MNQYTENLWGDIQTSENLRTPYIVLREQASILSQLTQGLLLGQVILETYNQQFVGTLRIQAPSLDNYIYVILQVEYPLQGYPVLIRNFAGEENHKKCENEEEFKAKLKNILSSEEVKRAISILLSQIQADVNLYKKT